MSNLFATQANTDTLHELIEKSGALLIKDSKVYILNIPFRGNVLTEFYQETNAEPKIAYVDAMSKQQSTFNYFTKLRFLEELCSVTGPHAQAYMVAKKYSESTLTFQHARGILGEENGWLLTKTQATSLRSSPAGTIFINRELHSYGKSIPLAELRKYYKAQVAPSSHAFTNNAQTKVAYEFDSNRSNAAANQYNFKTGMPGFYCDLGEPKKPKLYRFSKVHFGYTIKTTPLTACMNSIPKVLNTDGNPYEHFFVYHDGNICYAGNEHSSMFGKKINNEYAFTESTLRSISEMIELPKNVLRRGIIGSHSSVKGRDTIKVPIDSVPIDDRPIYINYH
jgi:hypothetical protein